MSHQYRYVKPNFGCGCFYNDSSFKRYKRAHSFGDTLIFNFNAGCGCNHYMPATCGCGWFGGLRGFWGGLGAGLGMGLLNFGMNLFGGLMGNFGGMFGNFGFPGFGGWNFGGINGNNNNDDSNKTSG